MPGDTSSDNLDIAAELQERLNREGIEFYQRRAAAETHPDFDGVHCVDDGTEIPVERLKLGRIRCVHCQQAKEKRERR